MILLDTSGLLSAQDASEPNHARAAAALGDAVPPRLLSPFVLAELDDLISRHVSPAAAVNLLWEVGPGRQPFRLLPADAA